MGSRLVLVTAIACALTPGGSRSASAQAPDSLARQVVPDSLAQQADSARQAILRRLERLGRPVGADSTLFLQDSLRRAVAQQAGPRPVGAADSVTAALSTMRGYSLTQYEGERADFAAQDRVLVLQAPAEGRARVSQAGSVIEADSTITFDERAGSIRTVGQATFTPPDGEPVDAVNMIYDLGQGRGSALGARTSWDQEGATWVVRGDMPFAAQDSTFMAHAQFTSCDLEEPHYHFETDEIKIVGGNVLVARGVRLYFQDVPVAWLPFMAQSLSRGRASGLLTPRFSVNDIVRTSGSYRRRISDVGFYWAMSDYSDAVVSMDWFSGSFLSLTGAFRYRVARQFLDGSANYRHFWNEDGSSEYALDTRHDWQMDERTRLYVSGRFVTATDFVREFSFNPQEVTQSINSEAGASRRFDWGMLSFSANRQQYLSDDRTEWLLPSANLSLSPITLFRAPTSEATFYNNMTWSGSANVSRRTVDRLRPDTFAISQASTVASTGGANSTLSLGRLSFSQGVSLNRRATLDVPEAFLELGAGADPGLLLPGAPERDILDEDLSWNAGVSYQQQLIGSTTLTPRFQVSGSMFRSDTDTLAQSFVSAPTRMSVSAQLKTDIYGFFGGFGAFEAVRHKISPSFNYEWSPAATPTALQEAVFGRRRIQPRNTISVSLNQTFEAKRATAESEEAMPQAPRTLDELAGDTALVADSALVGDTAGGFDQQGMESGPRRIQQNPSVTLLAWRTDVIRYDFVEADSVGFALAGFETVRLGNQFSSDYLRGLSISMTHELFRDELGPEGSLARRSFDLHLAGLNLGFSLGSSSSVFRWLGFGRGDGDDAPVEPEEGELTDAFPGAADEASIVPVSRRDRPLGPTRSGTAGGWNLNLSYSLIRPRDPRLERSQMLSGTLRMEPTENWSVSWRTSFDINDGQFNDHSIRLNRDLHRWQATFDFRQTATGNWTFGFEVSLLDNRDLKFDYTQRNLDLGLPAAQR
jgi:hypothetical protein